MSDDRVPAEESVGEKYALDPERQRKARQYATISHRVFFLETALGAVIALFLLFSGLSAWLANFFPFPLPSQVAAYFIVVMIGYTFISGPITYYTGFVLPHRYGLSHQSFGSWLGDALKGAGLGLVFGTVVIVIIYWLLSLFPDTWWLLAAAVLIFFSVVLAQLTPLIILPLFYKQKPLEDEDLKRRLLSLAEKSHTKVRGAFVLDFSRKGTQANAALMGLGNTRRIVLSDTLFGQYAPDEIEVVVAHELGHHVNHDIFRLIVVQSVTILAGLFLVDRILRLLIPLFGFNGIADIAGFPLLVLVLGAFSLIIQPLDNAYTRHRESEADRFALELSHNPDGFISMMTKLTDQNLGEAHPDRLVELFFYSHPPYERRVALARRYAESQR